MPALELTVNIPILDEATFVLEFSKAASTILGKPEPQFLINVKHNPSLSFGGTLEPAFLLTIAILGSINPESNKTFSRELFAFVKDKLGIPDTRGYITFTDPGPTNWGFRSTTVASLPREK